MMRSLLVSALAVAFVTPVVAHVTLETQEVKVNAPYKGVLRVYFPVVQECEKGVHRWIEIPTAGQSRSDLPQPAPELKLLPAAGRQH